MQGGTLGLQWGWEDPAVLVPGAEGRLMPLFPPPGPGMGLLVLALAAWLGLGLAAASEGAANSSRLCREAPAWSVKGWSPMAGAAGQVTVVALLKAS